MRALVRSLLLHSATVRRSRVRPTFTSRRQDPISTSASFTQINLLDQQEIFVRVSPSCSAYRLFFTSPYPTPRPSTGQERKCFISIENTMVRTTRDAPSAPRRETFITPTLLPICCGCKLVRDDTRLSPGRKLWIGVSRVPWRESGRACTHAHLLS